MNCTVSESLSKTQSLKVSLPGLDAFPWGYYLVPVGDAREHGKALEQAILDAQRRLLQAMNCAASVETTNDANSMIGGLLKDKR